MKRFRARAGAAAAALLLAFACLVTAAATGYVTTAVVELNAQPVAENIALETYRGTAVEGYFRSVDPDGDQVTYTVTKPPKKGSVTISGSSFMYTPEEGKKGKDTFRYVAIDSGGAISAEATVTIELKKRITSVTYADLRGQAGEYDAVFLAEEGLFLGETVGQEQLFCPDKPVTRGEFLTMVMALCGKSKAAGVTRTGFSDDPLIPVWQKPYIAAAVMGKLISGRPEAGKIVFSANEQITYAEAGVMLNNALNVTNVSVKTEETVPAWASQAVANLNSVSILISDADQNRGLTRRDAARLLAGSAALLREREDHSLLAWAKK